MCFGYVHIKTTSAFFSVSKEPISCIAPSASAFCATDFVLFKPIIVWSVYWAKAFAREPPITPKPTIAIFIFIYPFLTTVNTLQRCSPNLIKAHCSIYKRRKQTEYITALFQNIRAFEQVFFFTVFLCIFCIFSYCQRIYKYQRYTVSHILSTYKRIINAEYNIISEYYRRNDTHYQFKFKLDILILPKH